MVNISHRGPGSAGSSVPSGSKKPRIAAIINLPDGSTIKPEVNEDEEESNMSLKEPVIYNNPTEFKDEELLSLIHI